MNMLGLEPGQRHAIETLQNLQKLQNEPSTDAQNHEANKLKLDLKTLGERFKSVLVNYKTREELILQKCRKLEEELAFYKDKDKL
jgi:hypothetical protein